MPVKAALAPEPGRHASEIIRNSFFTAAARGIQILFSYALAVAITRYLAVGDFGEYAFVAALVGSAMAFADFGSQQVLIREIARDRTRAGEYVGVALLLRGSIAAVVIVVLLGVTPFLAISATAKLAVAIAVVAEFFLSFSTLTRTIFQSYEKMVYEPVLTLFGSLTLVAGTAAAIGLRLGFPWLFGAAALGHAVQLAVGAYLVRTRLVRPTFRVHRSLVLRFLKDIAVIGVGIILFINLIRVNVFMLKWLSTIEQVAFFQLPHGLIFQIQVLPYALVTAILPVFSRLIKDDPAAMAAIYQKVFKYMLVLSFFAATCLSIFSREFIEIVFGGKYAPSIPILAVVAWALVPLALDMFLNSILVAMNKQKYGIYYSGFALCFNFLAGLFLLPRYGALGAAFLALLSYGILFVCSFTLVSRFTVAISLAALARDMAPAAVASIAVMVALKSYTAVGALLLGTAIYFGVLRARGVVLPAEIMILRGAARTIRAGGSGPRG